MSREKLTVEGWREWLTPTADETLPDTQKRIAQELFDLDEHGDWLINQLDKQRTNTRTQLAGQIAAAMIISDGMDTDGGGYMYADMAEAAVAMTDALLAALKGGEGR